MIAARNSHVTLDPRAPNPGIDHHIAVSRWVEATRIAPLAVLPVHRLSAAAWQGAVQDMAGAGTCHDGNARI